MIIFITLVSLAITVMFNQSMYIVDEDAGQVSPILVINRLSLNNITVEVTNTDGSATGECCSILINYSYYTDMINMLQEEV